MESSGRERNTPSSPSPAEYIQLVEDARRKMTMAGDAAAGVFQTIQEIFRQYMDLDGKTTFTGVYLLSSHQGILALGPFVGSPTLHDLIPVGKGVVGTCLELDQVRNLQNVRECTEYLACHPDVMSELAIPLRRHGDGKPFGVLDLDSDQVRAYSATDVAAVKQLADIISSACLKLSSRVRIRSFWE